MRERKRTGEPRVGARDGGLPIMLGVKPAVSAAAVLSLALGLVLGAACSQAPAAKAPAEARSDIAGAPPTMENPSSAATPTRAPSQPWPTDAASSSAKPKTLAEAEVSFANAEDRVIALVGTTAKPQALSTDSCDIACKALASMKRATARLCELATDEPARCDDARTRLDRATSRVREVCGECGDPDG